jgi:hypothetical protein
MIQALTCLLLPFAGGCSAYARDVPAIPALLAHRAYYTGRVITITGRVQDLDQWRSRRGEAEQDFSVCSDGCVRVFMYANSPIRTGQLVTVSGPYYQAYHTKHRAYYNEIEGTQVLPRE